MVKDIQKKLRASINITKGKKDYFFKTGVGSYSEHDEFLGVSVPKVREIAKKFVKASFDDLDKLLSSRYNEERLLALLILIEKYKKENKERLVDFYLKNLNYVNNWNLVDLSCYKLLGNYYLDKSKDIFYDLALSNNLWKRRVAIVSTFEFIRNNNFKDTLMLSKLLINDKEDLIHKACGWMLREVGKRDLESLLLFLEEHSKEMPRTMLRYSIEKLDKESKTKFMKR